MCNISSISTSLVDINTQMTNTQMILAALSSQLLVDYIRIS